MPPDLDQAVTVARDPDALTVMSCVASPVETGTGNLGTGRAGVARLSVLAVAGRVCVGRADGEGVSGVDGVGVLLVVWLGAVGEGGAATWDGDEHAAAASATAANAARRPRIIGPPCRGQPRNGAEG